MKNEYLSYGGKEEELENITDEETLGLMISSQQKIHELLKGKKEI